MASESGAARPAPAAQKRFIKCQQDKLGPPTTQIILQTVMNEIGKTGEYTDSEGVKHTITVAENSSNTTVDINLDAIEKVNPEVLYQLYNIMQARVQL